VKRKWGRNVGGGGGGGEGEEGEERTLKQEYPLFTPLSFAFIRNLMTCAK
jgi:hypothetical protein